MNLDKLQNLYKQNREELSQCIPDNSLTIIESNLETYYNLDASYKFYQNSDLLYLTGINQPNTVLLILKKHGRDYMSLFIENRTPQQEIWLGKLLSINEVRDISGLEDIKYRANINKYIRKIQNDFRTINYIEDEKFKKNFSCKSKKVLTWTKKSLFMKKYNNISESMNRLRSIKKDIEIEIIKKACQITTKSYKDTLKIIKPDVNESELEGYFYNCIKKYGGDGFAYEPIFASGKDSCILHYNENNKICKKGDIILMDIGAKYKNYSADITRVFPIDQNLTSRQKEIYSHVKLILDEIKAIIKPGLSFEEYKTKVTSIIEDHLIDLKLITVQDRGTSVPKQYYIHGVSHHLGIDVHDRGVYDTLKQNMVLTIEPGIYLPNESIGIRLEDDIVIKENGIEVLTKDLSFID